MENSERNLVDPDWLKETREKRIVLDLPGMEKVRILKNLTYKEVPGRDLQADVFLPPNLPDDEVCPGIVFIHGGYLPPNLRTQPKDWGSFISYGQLLAASGLTAITFNHRYYGRKFLETSQADVKDLISYVRDNSQEIGIDKSRIHLWAFSGGGPLISWALRETPDYISSLVLYYTILDIMPQVSAFEIPEKMRLAFSPVHQLRGLEKDMFPIYIARAGLDRQALNQTIDNFIQTALSKNIGLEISNHASGQHGFDILDDEDRSRQIIHRTIEYILANS
jgi:acetyl esterase/lipase